MCGSDHRSPPSLKKGRDYFLSEAGALTAEQAGAGCGSSSRVLAWPL